MQELKDLHGCSQTEVSINLGINAHRHRNREARLVDVMAHPGMKPFFDALAGLLTFPTIRSNGTKDEGWNLMDYYSSLYVLVKCDPAGDWVLPIEKTVGDVRMTRGATFKSFLAAGVPGITPELLAATLAVLEEGILQGSCFIKS